MDKRLLVACLLLAGLMWSPAMACVVCRYLQHPIIIKLEQYKLLYCNTIISSAKIITLHGLLISTQVNASWIVYSDYRIVS